MYKELRSTEITHICTECGAECGADFEWDDGSGYFCDLCEAKDHYNYNLETDKRIINTLVKLGAWENLGWYYARMHEDYDKLQKEFPCWVSK